MAHDPDVPRFFTYLNLFVTAMLILVLADNLLLLFVGWEGVGLCSYLLIGFWWTKEENCTAGKKAMLVNRVGDAVLPGRPLPADPVRAGRSTSPASRSTWTGCAPPTLGGWSVPTLVCLLLLRRRHRQVGADPALRLAARRHGGSRRRSRRSSTPPPW